MSAGGFGAGFNYHRLARIFSGKVTRRLGPGLREHTWIGGSGFYSTEVDGVRLVDWVSELLDGEVTHVAPLAE